MANKTITMINLHLILQYKQQGLSTRVISKRLSLARQTVTGYLNRFSESGKSFAELLQLSDEALSQLVFADLVPADKDSRYTDLQSRLEYFLQQLNNPKTTKMILWEEYRQQVSEGYSRAQFYEHLSRYSDRKQAVMHFEHEPGKVMEFDFAGDPLSYIDRLTGEIVKCPVLICRLPFSGLTFIEALLNMKREQLITSLGHALDYFGGVPQSVKSDNLAQFVKKSSRYEPEFDEIAKQWSAHYNTFLSATRVAKPRDKASVESAVNTAYKRVYAPLRNKQFHSLREINQAIVEQTNNLNRARLQGRDYSRYDRFINQEKSLLSALPQTAFVIKYNRTAKVGKHYHAMLGEDKHFYSVPFQYIGQQVQLVYDTDNVEIFVKHQRIAVHKRDYRPHAYSTLPQHMPSTHGHMLERKGWNDKFFIDKAHLIGENTEAAVKLILTNRFFPEQSYNSCLGVLRLGNKYGNQRLENACQRALKGGKITYAMLSNILVKKLDLPIKQTDIDFNIPDHNNLRGSDAYS